ncbi:acyl-CoA carboxylase epsilon subunit [Streptomyces iconiensis]|uniref:Acyl-CoA carboxylase epsilon subunit n=1 Tax=Streptomyces iconiensis TaxID=1384038 RepID=A0ABT6ZTW0_9ACTN|nr:acyl-CoA carboxylase epsilon subunit [Streptomyces iconiensis]MDJ1132499.1 acyl-CoA carboxylase epsilon subunit [Streptomyces iconiensis]
MNNTPEEPGSTGPLNADADSASLVRVEKGEANEEELAAVTALLLARAAATSRHAQVPVRSRRTTKAGWRRLERQHGFRAPHSWQG